MTVPVHALSETAATSALCWLAPALSPSPFLPPLLENSYRRQTLCGQNEGLLVRPRLAGQNWEAVASCVWHRIFLAVVTWVLVPERSGRNLPGHSAGYPKSKVGPR